MALCTFYFCFPILTVSNITGRTVSALLAEELLEKIMLAKTKHKKLWKFY
jgi:aminopeptidase-like protein